MLRYSLIFLLPFLLVACSEKPGNYLEDLPDGALERQEWERLRQIDPATGKIPSGMRLRELRFAESLPRAESAARASNYVFKRVGPNNVGGRTRAFAMDVSNEDVLIAGGVSGGMWRSTNNGLNWESTTRPEDHHSVTCLKQDIRPGKQHIWYYGSGEGRGNSASGIFGANYLGTGIWSSQDSGKSWQNINSTNTGTPESREPWDIIWNIALDHTNQNEDVILAAIRGQIQRSTDAGQTWDTVLGEGPNTSIYTDVIVNQNGDFYASLNTGGSDEGIWRSADGINWARIDTPAFPNFRRMIMAEDPNRPNTIYFLGETIGSGMPADTNGRELNSLLRYTYLSGNGTGSGGHWENLSDNMPYDTTFARVFRSQGGYNLTIAIQPGDSNKVFIGGTNLFMSTDAFNSDSNTTQIGGYKPDGDIPFTYRWENHHPDQHVLFFKPSNPDILYNANDGGVYYWDNINDSNIEWTNLNRGYLTTQFYTIGIDHGTRGSELVFGGLQDNGTQLTRGGGLANDWVSPNLGDGSYCAAEDGGEFFYFSRQNARIIKAELDQQGDLKYFTRIDPEGAGAYLFINPFILDRNDNQTMYLSEFSRIWRNNKLNEFVLDSVYEKADTNWERFSSMANSYITTFTSSYDNPKYRLYYGSSNKGIYRVDSAHKGQMQPINITGNILTGGWTSSISVDPLDASKIMVTYSNYRVHSVYYSENGGTTWLPTAGNLEAEQPQGSPPGLGLGDGPSVRTSAIVHTVNGPKYFVGASIGLFSTDELKGDSTIWVQEAVSTIGNAVVDMIDYRPTDGFMAIGTHGKGVYTTYISDALDITSISEENSREVKIWPNPAKASVNLEFGEEQAKFIQLLDLNGRRVRSIPVEGKASSLKFDISDLRSGTYFLKLDFERKSELHKVVVL